MLPICFLLFLLTYLSLTSQIFFKVFQQQSEYHGFDWQKYKSELPSVLLSSLISLSILFNTGKHYFVVVLKKLVYGPHCFVVLGSDLRASCYNLNKCYSKKKGIRGKRILSLLKINFQIFIIMHPIHPFYFGLLHEVLILKFTCPSRHTFIFLICTAACSY